MTGDVAGMIAIAERRATARFCNTLFNLPEVLRGLREEFEKQNVQKLKFIKSQEGGRIP